MNPIEEPHARATSRNRGIGEGIRRSGRLSAILAAATLAGCGGGDPEGTGPAGPQGGPARHALALAASPFQPDESVTAAITAQPPGVSQPSCKLTVGPAGGMFGTFNHFYSGYNYGLHFFGLLSASVHVQEHSYDSPPRFEVTSSSSHGFPAASFPYMGLDTAKAQAYGRGECFWDADARTCKIKGEWTGEHLNGTVAAAVIGRYNSDRTSLMLRASAVSGHEPTISLSSSGFLDITEPRGNKVKAAQLVMGSCEPSPVPGALAPVPAVGAP